MKNLTNELKSFVGQFDGVLFTLGKTKVTPISIIVFVATIALAVIAGRLASRAIRRYFRSKDHAIGISYALERMVKLVALLVGVLIGLENVGIDLTALAAFGAMLSVGIGLGLQGVAQNFVSGITLLIERPVQKGDFVKIGDTFGIVDEIAMRATRIVTRDEVAIYVPNSELITGRVVNLSHPSTTYRARIKVGVAYGSDTDLVQRMLLVVATEHAQVLGKPVPEVFFTDFGDSSLDFELCVWIKNPLLEPQIKSELRFKIDGAFRRNGIQIPFPQRDLHLKSVWPPGDVGSEQAA